MSTYKYWNVRRDIFEKCSDKKLKSFRSFSDMKRLFNCWFWISLLLMILCLVSLVVLTLIFPNKLYYLTPTAVFAVIAILVELFGHRMYNSSEREKEKEKQNANLEEYVTDIESVLKSNGINTREQISALKQECHQRIDLYKENCKSISSKIYDVAIGVPLGAWVSAIIFKSSSEDTLITNIIAVILLGLMIIGIVKVVDKLRYYSEGYFKDQYLLDVLNELEYVKLNNDTYLII